MNVEELQNSIGKIVEVSDGVPRPPERFNCKLAVWEYTNYSGRLKEVKDDQACIIIMETSYLVMNKWTKNLKGISLKT